MKKLIAILFLLFIFLVIIAADTNTIPTFIRAIYRFPGGDWLGHFSLYGILAFLFAWAFPRRLSLLGRSWQVSVIFVVLLAAGEEVSQRFFSNRTPSLIDLAFGLLGIALGVWLANHPPVSKR